MPHWQLIKLQELITTNNDSIGKNYPYSHIKYLETGSITKGKISDISYLALKNAPSRAKRILQDEDIIYSSVRPINRHYGFFKSPEKNLIVSTGFITITCNKEKIYPLFLYYYLTQNHIVEQLDSIAEGSTSAYPSLVPSDIENLEILLPSLAEQKAIAAVLGSLDDKIDLLHRQNATLERMAETLFRQWFIEEAQEEWEECSLGDIVSIFRGASPRPIVNYVKGGNIPWIKIADATSTCGLFLFKTREFIITDGIKKSVEVYPGDLILSNSATCGLPLFVGIYGCIHDGWLVFRNFKKLPKEYIFFFLKSISQKLNSIADGSVQNNLNTNLLKAYPIKIPPKEKLHIFNTCASQHIAKIKSNQQQIQTLEKLRDTLLPKLLSGEVRVRVDE